MRVRWIVIGITVLVLGGIGVAGYFAARPQEQEIRTLTVSSRQLVQEVVYTGNVEAEHSSDLGFETTGTAAAVLVKVGDTVTEGQELVRLDGRAQSLQLAQASADQASSAEAALLDWQTAQANEANETQENARLVERRRQGVIDTKAELDQQKEVWQQTVREDGDQASTSRTQYLAVLKAETAYNAAQELLSETRKTAAQSNDSYHQLTVEAEAAYVATQQASSDVSGLSSLQAKQSLARVALSLRTIRAPFDGVVTAVLVDDGQLVTAGSTVVTVQTVDSLEVVAAVPESDAVKLSVGLPASVSLDAYPSGDDVVAEVTRIAPAAEVIEGVPTYEVTAHFVAADARLVPGLTADVRVQTGFRDDVLAVPRRAVMERDETSFVRVLGEDGVIADREVTTGLLGSDGAIEITSGLTSGEQVVVDSGG